MIKSASERRQAISTRKTPCDEKAKLWIQDEWRLWEVWRVPVEVLVLNVDNRRFAAERLWAEEQLGRQLDPENCPDDELCIESLLLDKSHRVEADKIIGTPSKDYESLRNDWSRRGQESPFWIRPEGTVRNGNRRLAMIKRVQREKGDTGLNWVNAVILKPDEIDEVALLEMEQREQLTENFKVRYNDIDYLLALREAAEIRQVDWFDRDSLEEIAGKLQTTVERTKSEVIRDLYAVKYMDLFLEDSGQPGHYHRLLRTLELFRDIGRMMIRVEVDYPDDFDRVLQVLFAGVRSGKKYEDIRAVRKMFRGDRPRFDQLATEIAEAEIEIKPDEQPILASPAETSRDESDEDEDDDANVSGPSVTNYPSNVGRLFDVAIDGYEASQQRDVLRIVREVLNRLESLDERGQLSTALNESEESAAIRVVLRKIDNWVGQRRRIWEPGD